MQAIDWGLALDETRLSLLEWYAELLMQYEVANVIGTRDREKILSEHLTDALSCFLIGELHRANSLIDIGTGGGLPGIPLGIACPQLQVTLLEATEKKVRFLEHVRTELELQNFQILHARAEDLGGEPAYREVFDIATARALAALPVVVEYCAPFVRTRGTILAMKGKLSPEELSTGVSAAGELGVALHEVREVEHLPPFPQKERRLVVLSKVGITPKRFPRRVGQAKKRPLGS